MRRGVLICAWTAAAALTTTTAAFAAGPVVSPDGIGTVDTTIDLPGSQGSGGARPIGTSSGPSGGGSGSGSDDEEVPVCTYTRTPEWDTPGPPAMLGYVRTCFVSGVTNSALPIPVMLPAGALPVEVTPEQLARRAASRLPLTIPTLHRSPVESNDFEGDPFTWANLWTWFWTDPADYQPLTQTLTLGAVSATVVAEPVGLVFVPGDGGAPVRCAGPGRPWTEADENRPPPTGCGYQYKRVTDGVITSQMRIEWRVTWTGTGGSGGTLPLMQTSSSAPLRVLQIQVVNQ